MQSPPSPRLSPDQLALRRLVKNKAALIGIGWIVLTILVAIFAYALAPDNTTNANDQIPEVALESPGFSVEMLRVKKNRTFPDQSFLRKMISGKPGTYQSIPILSYQFVSDSIIIERFVGTDQESGQPYPGIQSGYLVADVVYALSPNEGPERNGEKLITKTIDGDLHEERLESLQAQIKNDHIHSRTYLLGADRFGRCVFSRLLLGTRISLIVGLIAVIISLTVGILVGASAGYFGGKIDDFLMLLINTVWSIPTLILVFAIVLALGRGIGIIFLAVGLTMWVDVARIVRGQVMTLRQIQFVEAARSLGFNNWRIVVRHILPNIVGPVLVIAAANFATAILIEAGLSYLGFGIQPPTPSWGTMLNENYGYAISGKPFLALIPALAIMLLVLAFNLAGNGLRDALDVKGK